MNTADRKHDLVTLPAQASASAADHLHAGARVSPWWAISIEKNDSAGAGAWWQRMLCHGMRLGFVTGARKRRGRGRMQSEVRAYLGSGRECIPCRAVPVDTRIWESAAVHAWIWEPSNETMEEGPLQQAMEADRARGRKGRVSGGGRKG
jgi:hypothetical protein